MNIVARLKTWRNRRLFLKIYFRYLDRLADPDMAIVYARRDYNEIIGKEYAHYEKV